MEWQVITYLDKPNPNPNRLDVSVDVQEKSLLNLNLNPENICLYFAIKFEHFNSVFYDQAREKDATEYQQQVGNKIAETLRKLIAPYFLRRTKAEVFNLNKPDDPSSEANKENIDQNDTGRSNAIA